MKKLLAIGIAILPAIALAQEKPDVQQKPDTIEQPDAQVKTQTAVQEANTKSMFAAMYRAGTQIKDKDAIGGFAESDNLPRPIGKMKVQKGKVYLQAIPNEPTVFAGKYKGMTLLLVNATGTQRKFEASDSCLSIVQEALDKQGKWKPIEFFYSSFCGNSFHRVFLGPNEYWSFAVPRYAGSFKTKLRFRLNEGDSNLLSNEFQGSINPEQFTAPEEQYKKVPPPISARTNTK